MPRGKAPARKTKLIAKPGNKAADVKGVHRGQGAGLQDAGTFKQQMRAQAIPDAWHQPYTCQSSAATAAGQPSLALSRDAGQQMQSLDADVQSKPERLATNASQLKRALCTGAEVNELCKCMTACLSTADTALLR